MLDLDIAGIDRAVEPLRQLTSLLVKDVDFALEFLKAALQLEHLFRIGHKLLHLLLLALCLGRLQSFVWLISVEIKIAHRVIVPVERLLVSRLDIIQQRVLLATIR